jgi:hypothetical protein
MEFYYQRFENNELLWAFERNQLICKTLAYMVTFKQYENLKVTPKPHSIEIQNDDVFISVYIYVGYESNEYLEYINKKNIHIISFNRMTSSMHENKKFKNEIKFIDPKALFFTALSFSKNESLDDLKTILEI